MLQPMIWVKTGQKSISSWKPLSFEKFVSIDLLGPKDMFLSFAQNFSKYLVDPF